MRKLAVVPELASTMLCEEVARPKKFVRDTTRFTMTINTLFCDDPYL